MEYFYGVVNIDIAIIDVSIQYLNYIEVEKSYISNAYLHSLPGRISTIWQALILVNEKEMSLFVWYLSMT